MTDSVPAWQTAAILIFVDRFTFLAGLRFAAMHGYGQQLAIDNSFLLPSAQSERTMP